MFIMLYYYNQYCYNNYHLLHFQMKLLFSEFNQQMMLETEWTAKLVSFSWWQLSWQLCWQPWQDRSASRCWGWVVVHCCLSVYAAAVTTHFILNYHWSVYSVKIQLLKFILKRTIVVPASSKYQLWDAKTNSYWHFECL